jgi:hypothetical protein
MKDTDSIHNSGAKLTVAMPINKPFTTALATGCFMPHLS